MVQMNSQDSESSLPSQHCMSILQWALHGGVPPLIERGYEEDDSNVTASKFDHGQSNPTYLITIQSSRYPRREDCFRFVLRARPKGRLLPGAHRIDREFKVLASLRASPVPVPQVYGYCDDPTIIGSTFYAMEYIPGRIFKDASLREVASPKERAEIYREAVRVLCSLGELDTAKLGLRDLSKGPRPWIDRQISTWNRQFLASRIPGVDYRLMEALHRRLLHARQNQGKGEFTRAENHHGLVHGDYRLDNLIFHPEKPICIGVLDWELVSLGDPVADLATFLAPYHMPPEASSFEILRSATFPQPRPSGIPDELSLIRLYAKEVDERPFRSKLQLYLAVALFRFAAIIYGVQSRAAQGNASSSLGAKLGEHAHLYAQGAIVALDEISSLDNANSIESSSLTTLVARMWDFMKQEVLPLENKYLKHTRSDARWTPWEPLEILKGKAKTSGLWNLFLPRELGGSLSSSDYAALAEITGQCLYAAEVFNCSAPDTGKAQYITSYQG